MKNPQRDAGPTWKATSFARSPLVCPLCVRLLVFVHIGFGLMFCLVLFCCLFVISMCLLLALFVVVVCVVVCFVLLVLWFVVCCNSCVVFVRVFVFCVLCCLFLLWVFWGVFPCLS